MKKYLAPLIWAIIGVVGISLYYSIFLPIFDSTISKIIYAIGVIIIAVTMGFTLKKRFTEIKEEEKDDLSKY